jgi:predicted transcriptional regulator
MQGGSVTTLNDSLKTVTARIHSEKVAQLDEIAAHQDRDRSYLINEAIDHYLAHRQWMLQEIRKAVAEADAGRFLSDEESEAFMRELAQ